MTLQHWRFLTLLLVALTMGMSFAHVLEALPKLRWSGELYLAVQTNLYFLFGNVGAVINLSAIATAVLLAVLERNHHGLILTLSGAVALVAALLVWLVMVAPVNVQTGLWQSAGSVPLDWQRWRNQWELGHAISFGFHLTAFVTLLWAGLNRGTP